MSDPAADALLATIAPPATARWSLLAGTLRSARTSLVRSPALRAALLSRAVVWVAALLAIGYVGENTTAFQLLDPSGLTAPFASISLDKLVTPAARWDSVWYLEIARSGYFSPASSNFYPLYPLLVGLGSHLVHQPLLVGLAISLACMTAALALLRRLALLDLDERAADLTVLLAALYPMSLFMSAVYPTSLFLLLSIGALYAARRERWAIAGVCGALATSTRSDGILLVLPIVALYLYGPRSLPPDAPSSPWWRPRYRRRASAAWIALIPCGVIAYLAYLAAAHGAPLAPFHAARAYWGRSFAGPFGAAASVVVHLPREVGGVLGGTAQRVGPGDVMSWSAHDLIDLGFLLAGVAALAASWRRVPMAYFAYALLLVVYASSFPSPHAPLQGLPRYLLPAFPLYMGVGARIADRPRWRVGVLTASAMLLAVFSGLWGIWTMNP